MSWYYSYSSDIWLALITLALAIILGLYSWRRRSVIGAKAFAIGCLFAALWVLGSILEITATDFSTKVFWVKFQAVWQLPTVTAITCFFLQYSGLGRLLTRRNLFLLSIPPLLIILLIITNGYHHLMWTGLSMDGHVIEEVGIGSWISIGYAILLAAVNIIVLIRLAIVSPQYRWVAMIMLFGLVSGRIMYFLDSIEIYLFSPGESVLVVVGLVFTVYAFALFRFHVFDPIPLARATVIEQMTDGMIVLDSKGCIVDLNPVVGKIFGKPAASFQGQAIVEVLPAKSGIEVQPGKITFTKSEISLETSGAAGYYSLSLTPLTNQRGKVLGYLLLLHNITDQKRSQAKLMEQQRIVATLQERERLARELHDSTSQVLGYVNLQAQTIQKWLQTGDNQKAEALVSRLAEIAKNAHTDVRESILNLRIDLTQDWSFISALKQYINNFQDNYGIRTDLIITDEVGDNTLFPEAGIQLLRVIQETLTNARKHSNASNVTITIKQAGSGTHIVIMDDGAGFDIKQYDGSNDGHFGLVFMRERVEHIGGSMKIDSKPGKGTVVTLYVPTREQMEETK